ncbi:MAG: hypothetical protein WD397_11520 [Wenzhouxiangellaceae bacterium]
MTSPPALIGCIRGHLQAHRAGEIVEAIQVEFGIIQAAVSQRLRVLHESGFANVRVDEARRIYSVDATPLRDIDAWLEQFQAFWRPKRSALETEIAGGKKK